MLQTVALIAAFTLLGLISLKLVFNFFTFGLNSPPGPFFARFSDVWRFIDACSGQHHNTIVKLHDQYGPVVRLGPNAVSIADPAAIEPVYGLKANLDKSDSVKPMQNPYKGQVLPMLISAIDSKVHARIKRPVAGAYSMTTMLGFEAVADEGISKLMSKLREFANGERCLIDQWMSFFSFDFILQATFSQDFGFLEAGKDIDNMLCMLDLQFAYIGTMGAMPWLDNLLLKNPLLLMLLRIPNPLVDFASERVQARLQSEEEAPDKPDFLSRFIDAQKQYPDVVSELQLITYATTNMLAASDTTSAALTAIIYHVLKHPDIYAKLQAEIDGKAFNFPVSYTEANALPYLCAVIKEVLRIFPTAGIELERKVGPTGLVLPSGQRFPPGTIVGINAWPLHRDKTVFGQDADEFVPERWLRQEGESEKEFETRLKAMQRTILTFGAGPRACLGRHIASLELYKLLATLFGLFEVSQCFDF
jgi:cytochrome P450